MGLTKIILKLEMHGLYQNIRGFLRQNVLQVHPTLLLFNTVELEWDTITWRIKKLL